MKFILHLFISVLAIYITAKVLPGVHVSDTQSYVILAVVLGAINMLLKPILALLTLPLSIITLGLSSVILNALLIMLADKIVSGFSVDGFLTALIFGIVLSIISFVLKRFE